VLESTSTDPVPWVTVRPVSLAATVRATGAPGIEHLAAGPAPERRPPGPVVADRFGVLVPVADGLALPPARLAALEVPGPIELTGPDAWLAVQTFWVRDAQGALAVARRFRWATLAAPAAARWESVATALARDWSERLGVPVVARPLGRSAGRAFRRGSPRGLPDEVWRRRGVADAAATAELPTEPPPVRAPPDGHTIVFGASGAGKTTRLARWAADAIEDGTSVVAIDLHGDLVPAIVSRLSVSAAQRVVAVDATARPVPGIAALRGDGRDPEREAAHLVAALKRLTPDGTDLYWGFRLERIFDTFVRLVQETHGSLLDVFGLLTDADRRDAARLATRRPELARFLDELGPVLRRNPEFLWSAATRLSKVVLIPALGELLAPLPGGLPIEALVAEGRSVLVRLPFAALGPEAAQFAGTLVLGRIYLGLAADGARRHDRAPVRLVLDEVHGFSPRLVAEILTESRKFGVRALVATQYPERLPPELRAAAAGVLTGFVAFRVPRAGAREVGSWLGLGVAEADTLLPALPAGHALGTGCGGDGVRPIPPLDEPGVPSTGAWEERVAATQAEFGVTEGPEAGAGAAVEPVLLAVLAGEELGTPVPASDLVAATLRLPGLERAPEEIVELAHRAIQRGDVVEAPDGCRLTEAGARLLGLGRPTGASRETPLHRALLLRTFRVLARHGAHLEIVRQGRYDTTLPDAVLKQIPEPIRRSSAADLERAIARLRGGWAWRFFGGRDVHVEAEVSGARRAPRVRHDWAKARARDAFLLIAVEDALSARRARAVLRELGVGPERAQVWTLPTGLPPRAKP
jgi:hypothetical protein